MSEESTDTSTPEPQKKAASSKSTSKATAAKKAPAKKAATTRKTVKKAPAKKAAAKTAAAKTTAAKKPAAKKVAPRKTPAKTASAKTQKTNTKASVTADEQQRISEAADEAESTDAAARTGATGDNGDSGFDADQFKQAMKEKDWGTHVARFLFLVLYSAIGFFAIQALIVLAVCQLVLTILNDGQNETVRSAMTVLGRYIGDIMDYLSYATDDRPFPLGKDLPSDK